MKNRTAVVTGAAGAIGGGVVEQLIADGRRVVMVDRDGDKLATAASRLPIESVMTVEVDLGMESAAGYVAGQIATRWEPASILINNAGISPKLNGLAADLLQVSMEEWQHV